MYSKIIFFGQFELLFGFALSDTVKVWHGYGKIIQCWCKGPFYNESLFALFC